MNTLRSLPNARSENYIYLPVRSSIMTVVIVEGELKQNKSPAYIKHLLSLAEKVKVCLAILSSLWLCVASRSLLSTDTVDWYVSRLSSLKPPLHPATFQNHKFPKSHCEGWTSGWKLNFSVFQMKYILLLFRSCCFFPPHTGLDRARIITQTERKSRNKLQLMPLDKTFFFYPICKTS